MFQDLMSGLALILNLQSLLAIVVGIMVGIIIGATPGLTSNMALAIGVPLTFGVDPLIGIPFLLAMYKSSTYGGSISAILLNTPGTPAAAVTVLDGYKLHQQGKGGKALRMALFSSVFGDTSSDLVLIAVSAPLARVAMKFGPPEFAMLLLFSLTFTGGLVGKSMLKGLVSVLLGLLLATVGLDIMTAQPRFSFGMYQLTPGFTFIVVLIGMFTLSEVFIQAERRFTEAAKAKKTKEIDKGESRVTVQDLKRCAKPTIIGTIVGTFLGIMPAVGGAAACFIGYGTARSLSKNQERWGNGALEGVAAAEATNNAVCGANMVPLLSLGVPGNSAAAILGAALMIQGITPGPNIFLNHGPVIYAIFAAMILANFLLLSIAMPFIKVAEKAASASKAILFPIILGLSFVGSFAINNSMFDILVLIGFGMLGYIMRKLSFPIAPFVIAFLLGPMTERSIRQALMISRGDLTIFIRRPIALAFLILTILSIAMIAGQQLYRRKQAQTKAVSG